MTPDEYQEVIRLVCSRCRMGEQPRYRKDSREWIHDKYEQVGLANRHTQMPCWATGLRNSRFAENG